MMSANFVSPVSFRVGFAVLLVFSLACTQVPLFNYLGFEFSALTSVIVAFISGIVTLALWRKTQHQYEGSPVRFVDVSTQASFALLVVPFAVMSLNALFVKNCAYIEGTFFFLLTAVPAAFFTNACAFFIAVASRRWNRTLFTLFYVVILLHIPLVTFTGVQIFAFNPVLGFFPGFTYDETFNVMNRLMAYRVQTIAVVVLVWMLAFWAHKKKKTKVEWREIVSPRQRWTAVVAAAVVAGFVWHSDELGHSSSRGYIQRQLGGEIETDHFVISYPLNLNRTRVHDLWMLHEFYFDRISKELRVHPGRKIYSFVYASAEQKGALVGAGRTNIAKPWLWQLHINLNDVEAGLKHELVHVMAAEFGFPLLRIGLNSGLIEGLAVAVERVQYDAVIHRTAAEVLTVRKSAMIKNLFSFSGFLKAHPGVSYTLAGSFCRYLIDRYGLRRFKRVYRTGDFQTVYNRELEKLIADWEQHLVAISIRDSEKTRAVYLFNRPSIFGKECARTIANLNSETRVLFNRQDYTGSLASSNLSLERSMNVEALFQKLNSLFRLQRYRDAVEFAELKLKDSTVAHALLPMFLVIGDSHWAQEEKNRAMEVYQFLLSTHVSLSVDEACAVRLEAMFDPLAPKSLKQYFTQEMKDSVRIDFLRSNLGQKHDAVIRYLLGRELSIKERYREAIDVLSGKWKMDLGVLEFLRRKRIGQMHFKLGDYQKAKTYFWESLNFTSNDAYFVEIDEWLKRCDWMEEHAVKPNL